MECPVENHMDYPMDILRIILWNLLEYFTKSNGILYEIVWNILWDISCASVEYLIKSLDYPREYPMEYPVESHGI